jgi:hypothetical protein
LIIAGALVCESVCVISTLFLIQIPKEKQIVKSMLKGL